MKKFLIIFGILFAVLYFLFPRFSHAQESLAPTEEFSSFSSGYSIGETDFGSISRDGFYISVSFGTGCNFSYSDGLSYVFGVPVGFDSYFGFSDPPYLNQVGDTIFVSGPAQYSANYRLSEYDHDAYQAYIFVAECTDVNGYSHRASLIVADDTYDGVSGNIVYGIAIIIFVLGICFWDYMWRYLMPYK